MTERESLIEARDPNWECAECGHKMWAEFKGNAEFSVLVGCPGCGSIMDRLDPLGEIEREARHGIRPLKFAALTSAWPMIKGWIS